MAGKEKPYKLYRGGRVKGSVRDAAAKERARVPPDGDGYRGTYAAPPKKRRWARRIAVGLLLLVVLVVVWGVLGFLAFRSGVHEANDRVDAKTTRALAAQDGSLMSNPSNILLLGSDVGPGRGRRRAGLSDSIMLLRTDPDEHRIAMLSIPRDLRVPIAGSGEAKINSAFSIGGPSLAIKTVESLTGLGVNHVIVVDFTRFAEVIDALGGVTVDVREPIVSKFECPLKTPAQCARWKGWRFRRGPQKMDGRRALIYSRVRKNLLNSRESDFTRISHQQEVVQAIGDKATSFGTFVRLPFIGDDLVKPLATDLSTGELLQLAWVKRRAADDATVRCRLGGTISSDGSYLLAEDTRLIVAMVTGNAAPQPPRPGSELYGPGCFVGKKR